jgi:hypothetical protein
MRLMFTIDTRGGKMKAKAILVSWLCCMMVILCHAGARAQGDAKPTKPQRTEAARTNQSGAAAQPPRVINLTPKQLEAIRSKPISRLRGASLAHYTLSDKEIYHEVVNKLSEVLEDSFEHKMKGVGYDLSAEIMGYFNLGVSVKDGVVTLTGTIFITPPGMGEYTHIFGDTLVKKVRHLAGVKQVDWKMKYEEYGYAHPDGTGESPPAEAR